VRSVDKSFAGELSTHLQSFSALIRANRSPGMRGKDIAELPKYISEYAYTFWV